MQVIGVLNTKGGVGKTTLAICLAVRASADAKVAVVDLDPQSSYSEWYRRRGSPNNPQLCPDDRASDAIESLLRASDREIVILDGPPGSLIVTEDAIRSSNFVVIPIRASGLDIGASRDAIQMCQEIGVPFLVVINAFDQHAGKLVEQTKELLKSWGVEVAKTEIRYHNQYVNAITTGHSGPEKDKRCADDIDKLWKEIRASMKKAKTR